MKLSNKVDFNGKDRHLKPISLAPKSLNITAGRVCVATGWGKSKDWEKLSNILLKISQPIVDNISCQKAWPGIQWPISDGHICAGNLQEENGVCTGDSGGPLQCKASDGKMDKWIQVGVASWTSTPCILFFKIKFQTNSIFDLILIFFKVLSKGIPQYTLVFLIIMIGLKIKFQIIETFPKV